MDGTALSQRALESAMMHKRTRNFAYKADITNKKELLEDRDNSERYFRQCLREIAVELL